MIIFPQEFKICQQTMAFLAIKNALVPRTTIFFQVRIFSLICASNVKDYLFPAQDHAPLAFLTSIIRCKINHVKLESPLHNQVNQSISNYAHLANYWNGWTTRRWVGQWVKFSPIRCLYALIFLGWTITSRRQTSPNIKFQGLGKCLYIT